MEYGYQDLNPGLKVWYLLNKIRFDKLSTTVTTLRAHTDKYEKDFNAVITFLIQDIYKGAQTLSA